MRYSNIIIELVDLEKIILSGGSTDEDVKA
jgi:hypothetical protein